MNDADREEKALVVLDGLSVGDAIGEMLFSGDARRRIVEIESVVDRFWYTDDTAMALGILEVLRSAGKIDHDLLAKVFARRYAEEPDRGYGGGARHLLAAIWAGGEWAELSRGAFGGTGSMGNGGAMRVAPLGAWFHDDLDRVVSEARASAIVTHMHSEGVAGAIAAAVATAVAVRERVSGSAPEAAAESIFAQTIDRTPLGETRNGIWLASQLDPQSEIGDAVRKLGNGGRITAPDTVPFTLWSACRKLADYREAILSTAEGLGDCDTNCAIVGGIVASFAGREAIPDLWLERREPLRY